MTGNMRIQDCELNLRRKIPSGLALGGGCADSGEVLLAAGEPISRIDQTAGGAARQPSFWRVVWQRTFRLTVLFAFVCLLTPVQAADPYAAALDNLDKAVQARVQTMAQAPEIPPSPPLGAGNLAGVLVIFLALILGWQITVRILNHRLGASKRGPKPAIDPKWLLFKEEPSLAAFLEQLHSGEPPPMLLATPLEFSGLSERLTRFFDSGAEKIPQMQALLPEVSNSKDAAVRQKKLLELDSLLVQLKHDDCRTELGRVWHLATVITELVKQLARTKSQISESVLQTLSNAFELLELVCAERLTPPTDKGAPVKFLVLDHDALSRAMLSAALKKSFPPPDLAPDVQTGLSLASRQSYDGIFVDLETPGLDIVELCAKIHATELNPLTPFVFVTPHNDFSTRAKTILAGGQQLIGKPLLFAEASLTASILVLRSQLERAAMAATPKAAGEPAGVAPGPPSEVSTDKSLPITQRPECRAIAATPSLDEALVAMGD